MSLSGASAESEMSDTGDCPAPDALLKFAFGKMATGENVALEVHLDKCSACRLAVAEAAHTASSDSRAASDSAVVEPHSWAMARVGTVLRGKYRIDRVLGIGGMAVVYAATHRNRAEFAIKMLRAEVAVREDLRRRFLREGYVANTVKHPGAVAVVDDDVSEDGCAFLVMEMLHGAPLDAIVSRHRGPLSVEATLAIAHQLLEVLVAAHTQGITHRDIKPANIFVTLEGAVKVLDFGIARLRDGSSGDATGSDALIGTPAFMAPEQARGQMRDVDGSSDLWSVGATLFWLLSRKLVHESETPSLLVIATATRQARSLATLRGDVPPDVVHIVDRALAFEKSARWSSAAEMLEAVDRAQRTHFGGRLASSVLSSLAASPPVVFGAPAVQANENRMQMLPTEPYVDSNGTAPRPRVLSRWVASITVLVALARATAFMSREAPKTADGEMGGPALRGSLSSPITETPLNGPETLDRPAEPAQAPEPDAHRAAIVAAPPALPPPAPVAKPATAPNAAKASAAPKPRPLGSATPACSSPYYFDSSGRKHFKPECF